MGRFVGFPLLHKYGNYLRLTDERINQSHRWFERYGKLALFVGYFFPGLRHLTAFTAGASRLEYRISPLTPMPAAFVWVVTFLALGYFLGEEWHKILPQIQSYLWLTVGLVVFLALAATGISSPAPGPAKLRPWPDNQPLVAARL